ncbi:metal-dependent amidase/aminoacylase/carboxypeptidase [Penicillium brevicompactum]|uniref:metal-dependent amidase/aminoacylase/carboxypeptidase n=1 Tax=Penicillium brevicompactum TaxID=5074 RepID=UPI0025414E44|nr:metal-dependent amidase/aminoacylase/carboxypeptidase [Penicillium brevicompactum]KAJ5333345.1 metal-dependent amidase/aminoacylase/carboxypeptidase [Penicillium brevicompactum]
MAARLISQIPELLKAELGSDEVAKVACWAFHAGIPGADFVYDADLLFDVKTIEPQVRERIIPFIIRSIEAECENMNAPVAPKITVSERAPLTTNSSSIAGRLRPVLTQHFGSNLVEMETTVATEDVSALQGPYTIPDTYWNFGGSPENIAPSDVPVNHSPYFAPQIQPTLRSGADAMAIALLSVLA